MPIKQMEKVLIPMNYVGTKIKGFSSQVDYNSNLERVFKWSLMQTKDALRVNNIGKRTFNFSRLLDCNAAIKK
jgi:hypothetical protein